MNSRRLLPGILFASLFALHPAFAQDAAPTIGAEADAVAHASVPTRELAERYADLTGSTEAATALVEHVRNQAGDAQVTGYGEIDATLALAGELVRTGAAADLDTAVDTVLDMRADGMGLGQVAQNLGVDPGEVLRTAERADAAVQAAGGADVGLAVDRGRAGGDIGADTAASARVQAGIGRDTAANARVNAGVDAGLRGSAAGRPAGIGQPLLPRVERLVRPDRPQRDR